MINSPRNEETQEKYLKVKQKIELQEAVRAKGAQVRARAKWIEEGERNTKYFCSLEKARAKKNYDSSS